MGEGTELLATALSMDDLTLLRRFEAAELLADEWHHREHVRLAYLYLLEAPYDKALDRMRAGLKALNAAQNVVETLERGYHETLTQGWMHLVYGALSEYGPAECSEAFFEEQSHLLARRAMYFFYTRGRLRSPEAKAAFIEPDLTPLPRIRLPFKAIAAR
jgi:hypothetical protein